MASFVTDLIYRAGLSAVIGAAVGAATVTYLRNPSVDAVRTDTSALAERIGKLETASADAAKSTATEIGAMAPRLAAIEAALAKADSTAQLAEIGARVDAALVAAEAGVKAAADSAAGTRAAMAELGAAIAALPAPPAPADLAPVLDALARIEARLAQLP